MRLSIRARCRQALRALRMIFLYRNWLTAYCHRAGISLRFRNDVVYDLRPHRSQILAERGPVDVRIINEIWIDRIYEPSPHFQIQPGWRILDLGANKGIFTIRAALTFQDTKVYAVEPAPANLTYLRENIRMNHLSNVQILDHAIADKSGEVEFALSNKPDAHGIATFIGN